MNTVYMIAVVAENGEEIVMSGGIRKALLKVRCYDSEGVLSSAYLVLSELSELRKTTGFAIGDVIFFSGSLVEGAKDKVAIHPSDIYILRKGVLPITEENKTLIDARLIPYRNDRNIVAFDGDVCASEKENVCIRIKNEFTFRGDSDGEYHIWVVNRLKKAVKIGDKVTFVGEYSEERLVGSVYKS